MPLTFTSYFIKETFKSKPRTGTCLSGCSVCVSPLQWELLLLNYLRLYLLSDISSLQQEGRAPWALFPLSPSNLSSAQHIIGAP